jgi:hypothetical protein
MKLRLPFLPKYFHDYRKAGNICMPAKGKGRAIPVTGREGP